MGRRRIVNSTTSDESSEESVSSDSSVPTNTKKKATARKTNALRGRGKGRPLGNKRQKTQTDSDDDEDDISQPSTSGIQNNSQVNGTRIGLGGDSDSDGSETPDSDYGPINDDRRQRKKISSSQKRAATPVRQSPRKKKSVNNSISKAPKLSSKCLSFDPKLVEDLANSCVYFFLIEERKKYAIKRKAIVQHVFKDETCTPTLYKAVIAKANSILKKTFGMELFEKENEKDSYLIINILKRDLGIDEYVEISRLKNQQNALILYCLTVIFMNGNYITEDDLTKALKHLRIDLTSKKLHPIFGDVKKYITVELVKQMYLNYECKSKEPPCYEFTWGLRAKQELDKRDLLNFACKILDDSQPEAWILQYKDAEMAIENPA